MEVECVRGSLEVGNNLVADMRQRRGETARIVEMK
jgi:hypothetical protein